ncbi:hypothetical protein [Nocardia yunnanensis]|nr:hypothetical protein [Nocardia yunnanensis]
MIASRDILRLRGRGRSSVFGGANDTIVLRVIAVATDRHTATLMEVGTRR